MKLVDQFLSYTTIQFQREDESLFYVLCANIVHAMVIKEQTFPQLEDGVQRNPNFLYYREIAQELTSGMFFT